MTLLNRSLSFARSWILPFLIVATIGFGWGAIFDAAGFHPKEKWVFFMAWTVAIIATLEIGRYVLRIYLNQRREIGGDAA